MTRERMYGSDTEFCEWMRKCKDLPSYSKDFGFAASDNDVTVHRYMTCVDSVGTRDVQGIMQIEIKTRQGKPSESQMDTLSKLNLFHGEKVIQGVYIRFFGVFVLVMSGTSPDDSQNMWWCSMPKGTFISDASKMKITSINRSKLIDLLRFEVHPVGLYPRPFRRHHSTKIIMETETTPLGFEVERHIVLRS